MRTDLMLIAVAALATSFDRVVKTPSTDPDTRVLLAQNVGPLPTPALNPRLGAPPPGGHLGETGRAAAGAHADAVPGSVTVPADPAGRVGAMTGDRLGAPPTDAIAPQGAGRIAPPAAGAVPPPAAGAVQPPPGSAVAPGTR